MDPLPQLQQRLRQLEGNPRAVRALLEDAARRQPGDGRILLLLGAERVQAADPDGAELTFAAALQAAPELHMARFQLGLLQLTNGKAEAGLLTWAPLERLDEEHPLRLFAAGLTCIARDEWTEGRRLLRLGILRNSDNAPLNRDMSAVLAETAHLDADDTGAGPRPDADTPVSAHFLVSTYKPS